ncbi:MAG: metallophosphoesterase [Candidatus Thorarchaeota archaeon]
MKILAISDFHGKTEVLPVLGSIVRELRPDGMIFTGDVVKGYARGDEWLAARKEGREPEIIPAILAEEEEDLRLYDEFFTFFEAEEIPLFLVPGNMDAPVERFSDHVVQRYRQSPFIRVVHDELHEFHEFKFAGFGGELTPTGAEAFFVRRYLEEEAIDSMRRLLEDKSTGELSLLFHSPPEGEAGNDEGTQKGSQAINRIIEMLQPAYVFCGHAHKARAIEKVNNTTVINPGALKDGCYAIVDIHAGEAALRKFSI